MIFTKKENQTPIESQELLFKAPYIWWITLTITTFNFLISYNLKKTEALYTLYFIFDFIITYLSIAFYAFGIKLLNTRIPLETNFVKRVLYQFTLHTLAVITFNILLNELFDIIFFSGELLSLSFAYYTRDVPLAILFIMLLHAIYFALYLMSNRDENHGSKIMSDLKIQVTHGTSFVLLSSDEILCIYSQFGVTHIVNNELKKYTSDKTLKDFEKKMTSDFFRANRQVIISKHAIKSYKSSSFGKVQVHLKPLNVSDFDETLFVSKDKASSFRSWLRQTQNVS